MRRRSPPRGPRPKPRANLASQASRLRDRGYGRLVRPGRKSYPRGRGGKRALAQRQALTRLKPYRPSLPGSAAAFWLAAERAGFAGIDQDVGQAFGLKQRGDPVGDIALSDPVRCQCHAGLQSDRCGVELHLAPAGLAPHRLDSPRIRPSAVCCALGPERLQGRVEPAHSVWPHRHHPWMTDTSATATTGRRASI